ncbi:uncharacterized protein [Malus domestica]|uniref:uncharacterized protein n=1 Tax=Malus domestica TaxID=3750 RepID=UPI003975DBA5
MDSASSIILYLTELYGEGTRNRRFSTVSELIKTKMIKGAPVHQHFVMNYNMNKMDNTFSELLNMLVTAEKTMKKENIVETVAIAYNKASSSKAKPKGKGKRKEKSHPLLSRKEE